MFPLEITVVVVGPLNHGTNVPPARLLVFHDKKSKNIEDKVDNLAEELSKLELFLKKT